MAALHDDRRRAESFGADAARYDRARPSYPAALVDDVLDGVAGGVRAALDVGCGTGKAARLLRERRIEVLGVEPDARMAGVARERHGLRVEIGAIEAWDPAGRTFDLAIAAQAWHWVDPVRGAAQLARVLRPGGRAATFWNFGTPEPAADAALRPVYARLEPELERHSILLGNGSADRLDATADGLARTGAFAPAEHRTLRWERRFATAEWLEHLQSHSDHATLPADRRARLLDAVADALGDGLTMVYDARLVRADRV